MNNRFAPSITVVDLVNHTIKNWLNDFNKNIYDIFQPFLSSSSLDDPLLVFNKTSISFEDFKDTSYQLASRVNSWLTPLSVSAGVDDLISPMTIAWKKDWDALYRNFSNTKNDKKLFDEKIKNSIDEELKRLGEELSQTLIQGGFLKSKTKKTSRKNDI